MAKSKVAIVGIVSILLVAAIVAVAANSIYETTEYKELYDKCMCRQCQLTRPKDADANGVERHRRRGAKKLVSPEQGGHR